MISEGPSAGYFVSQTSALADASRGVCDQSRYLDSLVINSIVLPRNASWKSQGSVANEYELVAVRDRASGRIAYAIVGDRGPARTVGEGSISLTAALAGRQLNGQETYQEIKNLHRSNVDYVVFTSQDIRQREPGPITAEKVDRLGRDAFERWGGVARLDACKNEIGGGG